jgi:membrane protease YdiL (CAAX protease family)
MKKFFINSEGRFRAGWRIFIQFILFMTILLTAQGIQDGAIQNRNAPVYLMGCLIYIGGMILLLFVFSRFVDRRPFIDYGLQINQGWWIDLIAGLVIGAFTLTAVAIIESGMGWAEFKFALQNALNIPVFVMALLSLLNMAAVSWGEELTFRGYQLTNLAEGFGKRFGKKMAVIMALCLSSAFFGIVHLLNPNAGLMPVINISLAGLLLGLSYVWSGSLALPLGIHIAWGYVEEFVFGYANSGQVPANTLMQNTNTGPGVWTGGAFGPEGGLLIFLLIILDMGLVMLWIKCRKQWNGIHTSIAEYPKEREHNL